MSASPHALVIGGGIAGPATALFLRRAGYNAAVYEAHDSPLAGAALTLAPNGMAVMAELGLAERIAALGTPIERFEFRSRGGFKLGGMAYAPKGLYRHQGVSISRAKLHAVLLQTLAERGIAVETGKRLCALDQDADKVTARFADGTTARGDVLVGADGIRSAVRGLILADAPKPAFTGLIGAGGFLPRETFLRLVGPQAEATMTFCFGDGAFVGFACGDRTGSRGAYWWHALACDHPPSGAEREALFGPEGVETLLRAGHGWHARVRDILAATSEHIGPFDLYDVASLPRWSDGRVVLIGDAAHAVSPHSGQGASMALEDAIVLGKALRRGGDLRAAFAAYEAERRPRAERVVAYGRRSGDQKRVGRVASLIRTLMMPIFLKLAPAPHWLLGHDIRWDDGEPEDRRIARAAA